MQGLPWSDWKLTGSGISSVWHKETNVLHQLNYWVSYYLPETQDAKINWQAHHPVSQCFHKWWSSTSFSSTSQQPLPSAVLCANAGFTKHSERRDIAHQTVIRQMSSWIVEKQSLDITHTTSTASPVAQAHTANQKEETANLGCLRAGP